MFQPADLRHAKWLRERIREKGRSVSELNGVLGKNKQWLENRLAANGVTRMPPTELKQLASELGITVPSDLMVRTQADWT